MSNPKGTRKSQFTPLPGEEPDILSVSPVYDSRELDVLHPRGRFPVWIEREKPAGQSCWDAFGVLRAVGPRAELTYSVSAFTQGQLDEDGCIMTPLWCASVWVLLGYLDRVGYVRTPLCAAYPIELSNGHYVAYWGRISEAWYALYLIDRNTKRRSLQQLLDTAHLLVCTTFERGKK